MSVVGVGDVGCRGGWRLWGFGMAVVGGFGMAVVGDLVAVLFLDVEGMVWNGGVWGLG